MTGGKMGISFKTEKVLKSNSKKEVVTLDIFIEEYGKSALPYLSKSGGEKVKASLSVILALAEIKSSTAGIQLGMLFIDEPPFLDSDGIQAYCDSLETIQSRYKNIKIMAITHDPTMKARFPQSIDVVKTENGSKVIY
jgi:exonuclease SbcC